MSSLNMGVMSDLHLEFEKDSSFGATKEMLANDVVVLAGDTNVKRRSADFANSLGVPVIKVLGNHEYYGKNLSFEADRLKAKAGPNTHVLENDVVVLNGVRFVGATLWTDYDLLGAPDLSMISAEDSYNGLTDFKQVRVGNNYRRLRPTDLVKKHKESLIFLRSVLEKKVDMPTVVVTHHAPCELSVTDQFMHSPLSPAYASRLSEFVLDYQPEFWVHGHVHTNSDYFLGHTRVLCNPRGYVGHRLNPGFNDKLSVKVRKNNDR